MSNNRFIIPKFAPERKGEIILIVLFLFCAQMCYNTPDTIRKGERMTWEELKGQCLTCTGCGLCETRTNVVFGDGVSDAEVLFVGEGPGQNEDEQGLPFVGRSGALLDSYLHAVDLDRKENVFIANIVKCRPPKNRDPLPEERAACLPWLREQFRLLRPKIVVCLGRIAAQQMIRPDFSVKPAAVTLAVLNRELGDAEYAGELAAPEGIRAFLFTQPDGLQTLAVWMEATLDRSPEKFFPKEKVGEILRGIIGRVTLLEIAGKIGRHPLDPLDPLEPLGIRFVLPIIVVTSIITRIIVRIPIIVIRIVITPTHNSPFLPSTRHDAARALHRTPRTARSARSPDPTHSDGDPRSPPSRCLLPSESSAGVSLQGGALIGGSGWGA